MAAQIARMGQFTIGVGLAALLLSGCMKHVQVRPEVVVRRPCIISVDLTDDSECRRKPDETAMHCSGLKLNKLKGCEELEMVKSKEKKK